MAIKGYRPSKLVMSVRFPSPAPPTKPQVTCSRRA